MFCRAPNELTTYTEQSRVLLDTDVEAWKEHQEKITSLIYPALDLSAERYTEKYIDKLNKLRQPLLHEALARC